MEDKKAARLVINYRRTSVFVIIMGVFLVSLTLFHNIQQRRDRNAIMTAAYRMSAVCDAYKDVIKDADENKQLFDCVSELVRIPVWRDEVHFVYDDIEDIEGAATKLREYVQESAGWNGVSESAKYIISVFGDYVTRAYYLNVDTKESLERFIWWDSVKDVTGLGHKVNVIYIMVTWSNWLVMLVAVVFIFGAFILWTIIIESFTYFKVTYGLNKRETFRIICNV